MKFFGDVGCLILMRIDSGFLSINDFLEYV